MQDIVPVDFIDVSHMAGALVLKHASRFGEDERRQKAPGSPHHDTQSIILRAPILDDADRSASDLKTLWQADIEHADWPLLQDWPSARAVLRQIAESHLRRSRCQAAFGKIMVVSLKAGGYVDWHIDEGPYAEAHDRFHLCLVPSPGARIFAGGEAAILPYGQLTWINNRTLHSAINLGPCSRIHLIVDIRKPEPVH